MSGAAPIPGVGGVDSPDLLVKHFPVSRETRERLETHRALLAFWSQRMNLVGPRELDVYWGRHALDCAQLLGLAPERALRWLDLGAGAGFPGLVIAAQIADLPEGRVDLVEKSPRKAEFLRAAVAEMGVPARVLNIRVEDAPLADYDVITARAFAPLPRLVEHARRFLDRGAVGLFPKGADYAAELTAAGFAPVGGAYVKGSMRADAVESVSNPAGRVLRLRATKPAA